MGAQKNRLTETVLLSTHNICFGWEMIKIAFQYALLSGGLIYDSLIIIKVMKILIEYNVYLKKLFHSESIKFNFFSQV